MAERIWYLQQCRLFELLSPAELAALEDRSRVKSFPKNSPVYLPGDVAEAVYVLLEGRIRLMSLTEQGKQGILAFIDPGDLFGELAVAGVDEREEYAEAAVNSKVLAIPRTALDPVMQKNAAVTLSITKLIGWRRQKLERRLRNLLFHSNRERLIGLLWELLPQYGKNCADGVLLDIKLSHQELANLIGVTRESVTVTLGELQQENLVQLGRQRIVIRDAERLAAAAGASPTDQLKARQREGLRAAGDVTNVAKAGKVRNDV